MIRRATPDDAAVLHGVAADTFALACPPETTAASIDHFIRTHLSTEAFAGYLADPERELFLSETDGVVSGYTMVVFGEPTDADVAASVTARPTAELSKVYVRAEFHGTGIAAGLVDTSIAAARARGCAAVWLGVNQQNERANRFYAKCGFVVVGAKKFTVGDGVEDDFVLMKAF